jgi:ADP-L-glycero-D-manno-heptose 6-epimerase
MIVVTGSAGFIGGHLYRTLVERGLDVRGIEMMDVFRSLDIDDWSKVTHLYHLGAITDTTTTDIGLLYSYNIDCSFRLFEKALQHGFPVTYASSASVYGNSEKFEINPLNYYSMSKATVDLWVEDNMHRFSNIVGLRYFNVYGEGEDHKKDQASPISKFLEQAKTGTIKIFEGSETMFRDFVCVSDVVSCTLTEKPSGIYDVGTGQSISFADVAEMISEKTGATIETIPFPEHLKRKYQYFTQARGHFQQDFMLVEDYLNQNVF